MVVAVSNEGKEMSPAQELYYRLIAGELDLSSLVDSLYEIVWSTLSRSLQ